MKIYDIEKLKEDILKIRNKYTKKIEDAKTPKQFEKAVNDYQFKEESEIDNAITRWEKENGYKR